MALTQRSSESFAAPLAWPCELQDPSAIPFHLYSSSTDTYGLPWQTWRTQGRPSTWMPPWAQWDFLSTLLNPLVSDSQTQKTIKSYELALIVRTVLVQNAADPCFETARSDRAFGKAQGFSVTTFLFPFLPFSHAHDKPVDVGRPASPIYSSCPSPQPSQLRPDILLRHMVAQGEWRLQPQTVNMIWSIFRWAEVEFSPRRSTPHWEWMRSLTSASKYTFLPVNILHQVLCKIREEKESVLQVAPKWPTHPCV